jgi:hypothetical protein
MPAHNGRHNGRYGASGAVARPNFCDTPPSPSSWHISGKRETAYRTTKQKIKVKRNINRTTRTKKVKKYEK